MILLKKIIIFYFHILFMQIAFIQENNNIREIILEY